MKKKALLKLYLKRTKLLLKRWQTVPRSKVDLAYVSWNTKRPLTQEAPITLTQFSECGSVGCIAGWAYAFFLKDTKSKTDVGEGRMFTMDIHYGTQEVQHRAHDYLFSPYGEDGKSEWLAAKDRIKLHIHRLEVAIKEVDNLTSIR